MTSGLTDYGRYGQALARLANMLAATAKRLEGAAEAVRVSRRATEPGDDLGALKLALLLITLSLATGGLLAPAGGWVGASTAALVAVIGILLALAGARGWSRDVSRERFPAHRKWADDALLAAATALALLAAAALSFTWRDATSAAWLALAGVLGLAAAAGGGAVLARACTEGLATQAVRAALAAHAAVSTGRLCVATSDIWLGPGGVEVLAVATRCGTAATTAWLALRVLWTAVLRLRGAGVEPGQAPVRTLTLRAWLARHADRVARAATAPLRARLARLPDENGELRRLRTYRKYFVGALAQGWTWGLPYVFFTRGGDIADLGGLDAGLVYAWLPAFGTLLGVTVLLPLTERFAWLSIASLPAVIVVMAAMAVVPAFAVGPLIVVATALGIAPFAALSHLDRSLPQTKYGRRVDHVFGVLLVTTVLAVIAFSDRLGLDAEELLIGYAVVAGVAWAPAQRVLPRRGTTSEPVGILLLAPWLALRRDEAARLAFIGSALSVVSLAVLDPLVAPAARDLLGPELGSTVSTLSALSFPAGALLAGAVAVRFPDTRRLLQISSVMTLVSLVIVLLFGLAGHASLAWLGIAALMLGRLGIEAGTTITTLNIFKLRAGSIAITVTAMMAVALVGKQISWSAMAPVGTETYDLAGWSPAICVAIATAFAYVWLMFKRQPRRLGRVADPRHRIGKESHVRHRRRRSGRRTLSGALSPAPRQRAGGGRGNGRGLRRRGAPRPTRGRLVGPRAGVRSAGRGRAVGGGVHRYLGLHGARAALPHVRCERAARHGERTWVAEALGRYGWADYEPDAPDLQRKHVACTTEPALGVAATASTITTVARSDDEPIVRTYRVTQIAWHLPEI